MRPGERSELYGQPGAFPANIMGVCDSGKQRLYFTKGTTRDLMSRHLRPKVGQIINYRGLPTDITQIRIDENPAAETPSTWWGGFMQLSWGAIVHPGTFRLVLNDGRSGYVVIDEIKSQGDGGEYALFHGDGPPPF